MNSGRITFEVTQEHLALFRRLSLHPSFCVTDSGHLEVRPAIDYKRPFGNSGVTYDACEILGYTGSDGSVAPKDVTRAMRLIAQLPVAIECFCAHGRVAAGTYRIDRYGAWCHYKNIAMAIFWREAIEACAGAGLDAEKAAEFAANTPARGGNPYSLLRDMSDMFQGSEENRRILRVFEDEAIKRYESVHGCRASDRAGTLERLKDNTAGMSWPGWPFSMP